MDTPSKPEDAKADPNDGFGPPDEDDSTDIEPVAPAKPKAKPTPEKPVVSPSLRRTAKMFGISEDDIDNASPDQLQDAIAYIAEERERSRASQPVKSQGVKEAEDEDDDSILESLDKELQLDPRLKKLLKKQTGSAKEIKDLKIALAEQGKREQARLTRAGNDAADDAFDSLGDDFKDIFGEGDIRQLKKDGEELAARLAVYQSAGIDLATDSPSSIKRKIMGAAKKLYGKFAKKAAAKAPEDEDDEDEEETEDKYAAPKPKVKPKSKSNKGPDLGLDGNTEIDWDEARTARPTNRKTPEKKGVKAAANAVRQFYQEKGFPGSADEDVFNGVPE